MPEIIARRQFYPLYIWLDLAFLLVLTCLLLWRKKYMTVLVGLCFGIVYFAVDFGIFHLVFHARSIEGGDLFWVLLWMSMSYGFTNFAWIWLWLSKDKHLLEWSLFILLWWLCCPMLTSTFGSGAPIVIQRTTSSYHGWMAAILIIGYGAAIIWNLSQKDRLQRVPLLFYLIFIVFSAKFTERLKKRTIPVALVARISENNSECVRGDHCGEYLT